MNSGQDQAPSVSVFRKRLKKFRSLKRGYYSFLILAISYVLSFFLPLMMNSKALVVKYDGKYYYPIATYYQGKTFKQINEFSTWGETETNYRLLRARCEAENKGNWVWMPFIPYSPTESAEIVKEKKFKDAYKKGDFSVDEPAPKPKDDDEDGYSGDDEDEDGYSGDDEDEDGDGEDKDIDEQSEEKREEMIALAPPYSPSSDHWFGTDDRGRDLLCRLAYGYNVSMTFAIILVIVAYTIGISIGAILGYYGGVVDLFGQRIIEVWQTVPFLFTVMILGSAMRDSLTYRMDLPAYFQPSFVLLISILAVFSWMGMTYYVRGEFLREKSKDYVSAAISIGTRDHTIIFKHILPNALTPVVTFAPFAIVGNISSLVALDYLGFGLPAPTPSWGELMQQALQDLKSWWLVSAPIGALFLTLLLVVFVGEAVREAFDPKVFSRLR
jgi:ABC-type microcin C transport system permease subunit YejE